jgi:hypothetical protein
MPLFALTLQFQIEAKAPINVAADTAEEARAYLDKMVKATHDNEETHLDLKVSLLDRTDFKRAKASDFDVWEYAEDVEERDVNADLIIRRSDLA